MIESETAPLWGLIPAHAGKTQVDNARTPRYRAHPRSRGENCVMHYAISFSVGSSPLTRGKLNEVKCCELLGGLIPAHAGKTRGYKDIRLPTQAHPRSRGENTERGRKQARI